MWSSKRLAGAERAGGEATAADTNRRNSPPEGDSRDDEVIGVGIIFDVHFAEFDTAISQERLCAVAIGTPDGAVDCDWFHRKKLTP